MSVLPHPFPYQGSKRGIAKLILPYFPVLAARLVEPFCGSAAVSIAAAAGGLTGGFVLNDSNGPLIGLWREILAQPVRLADAYESMWLEQSADSRLYFAKVRDEFNNSPKPELMLYLLARIVKGSIRYNSDGRFNQSPDNRRLGMHPDKMRANIMRVSALLAGKAVLSSVDYRAVLAGVGEDDLVYMDPPYQGTSSTRDGRYLRGLAYLELVESLESMNDRGISYVVSYDGHTGGNAHGKMLPRKLSLRHAYVNAGRSSQATLLGRNSTTYESLYISSALADRLAGEPQMVAC